MSNGGKRLLEEASASSRALEAFDASTAPAPHELAGAEERAWRALISGQTTRRSRRTLWWGVGALAAGACAILLFARAPSRERAVAIAVVDSVDERNDNVRPPPRPLTRRPTVVDLSPKGRGKDPEATARGIRPREGLRGSTAASTAQTERSPSPTAVGEGGGEGGRHSRKSTDPAPETREAPKAGEAAEAGERVARRQAERTPSPTAVGEGGGEGDRRSRKSTNQPREAGEAGEPREAG